MTEFNLMGGIEEEDGKFQAVICLQTPDHKSTKIVSGYIFETEREARAAMEESWERILSDFTKNHEVEVLSKNGVMYQ